METNRLRQRQRQRLRQRRLLPDENLPILRIQTAENAEDAEITEPILRKNLLGRTSALSAISAVPNPDASRPGGAPESSRSVKRGTSGTTGTHVPLPLAPRRGCPNLAGPAFRPPRWKIAIAIGIAIQLSQRIASKPTTSNDIPGQPAGRRALPIRGRRARLNLERQRCGSISIPGKGEFSILRSRHSVFPKMLNRRRFDYDYDNDYDNDSWEHRTRQSVRIQTAENAEITERIPRKDSKIRCARPPRSRRSLRSPTRPINDQSSANGAAPYPATAKVKFSGPATLRETNLLFQR